MLFGYGVNVRKKKWEAKKKLAEKKEAEAQAARSRVAREQEEKKRKKWEAAHLPKSVEVHYLPISHLIVHWYVTIDKRVYEFEAGGLECKNEKSIFLNQNKRAKDSNWSYVGWIFGSYDEETKHLGCTTKSYAEIEEFCVKLTSNHEYNNWPYWGGGANCQCFVKALLPFLELTGTNDEPKKPEKKTEYSPPALRYEQKNTVPVYIITGVVVTGTVVYYICSGAYHLGRWAVSGLQADEKDQDGE